MNIGMMHPIGDLVTKRGAKNGFHVEHILSRNAANLALFNGDTDRFEQERNRLGAVLLLKGKDNISSGNELYSKKIATYANAQYWNVTLRADTYKSKLDLSAFIKASGVGLQAYPSFGPAEVDARQRCLFDIAYRVWA